MTALWRKARADLWGRRWQSLLILSTVGAAAALLYLGLLALTTATSPFDRLMERTNGAHAYFLLDGPDGGAAMARQVAADQEVLVSELRPVYGAELIVESDEGNPGLLLMPVAEDQPAVLGWALVAGRNPAGSGEGVLAVSVARRFGIEPGSVVRITTPTGPRSLTVVGLAADATSCPYPTCSPQNLVVRPDTFADLTRGDSGRGALLGVRLRNPDQADRFISRALKHAGTVRVDASISWLSVRLGVQLLQGLSTLSLLIFAVTAMAAGALITVNLISGAVLKQFREIAVLKVLGFTARQVQALFAGQNMVLGAAGGVLGVAAGHGIALRTMTAAAENLGNPSLLRFHWPAAATVLAVILAVSGGVALLAAWPAVTARPAAALRDGFAAPRAGVPLPVRWLTRLRAPVPVILGVKDVSARPGRAALTVLSLMLCLLTVGLSAGVGSLTRAISSDLDLLGVPYDLVAGARDVPGPAVERLARELEGVESVASKLVLDVRGVEQEHVFRLEAMTGDWAAMPWQVTQGRLVEAPGEIMLAPGAMRRLGVTVGDRLRLEVAGREVEWTVVGEVRNPMELGQRSMALLESVAPLVAEAAPNQVIIRLRPGVDPAAIRQALLDRTDGKLSVLQMRTIIAGGFLTDLLDQVRVLALLMAAIAALSMLNTALLTAREQMREAGIRKALGMTPLQVLGAVAAGGAWLGLVGVLLGVPLSLGATQLLVNQVAEALAYGNVAPAPSFGLVVLLTAGGVVLCSLSAVPAALWAGRLPTAAALRAE